MFLIFTISFSTESLLKKKFVAIDSDLITTPLKLYDFFIYPSNANFKNCILPFISSSENLLKIYFHFKKLDPKINFEKFLPYSKLIVTVLDFDLKRSHVAYIFENQFNPIIISENPYKTINCSYIDKNINGNSICALFSSNKIFTLDSYILSKNQEVFAAYDESDSMVCVALKKNQENFTVISHGKITKNKMTFPNCLDIILEVHNLSILSKIYYKVYDSYYRYNRFIDKIIDKCATGMYTYTQSSRDSIQIILTMLFPVLIFFLFVLVYHINMFPFHILSIPFELYLSKYNVNCLGAMTTNFFDFWLFPFSFHFIFRLFFVHFNLENVGDYAKLHLNEIHPRKTMFVLPYLQEQKKK